jgi:hypothetical protein
MTRGVNGVFDLSLFKALSVHLLGGAEKTRKTSLRIAGIRTQYSLIRLSRYKALPKLEVSVPYLADRILCCVTQRFSYDTAKGLQYTLSDLF